MSQHSSTIIVAVVLIIVLIVLLIAYSYYPSSCGYNYTTPVVDAKVAQQAAARRQRASGSLSASPDKETDQLWNKWSKANGKTVRSEQEM